MTAARVQETFEETLVSILMPVYNEAGTLAQAIERVRSVGILPYRRELLIVDDGSTDGSTEILTRAARAFPDIRPFYHARNRGQGAALKTALDGARGAILIFQDADLEMDPSDYPLFLRALKEVPAVFGSRTLTRTDTKSLYPLYALGSRIITIVTNTLYGTHLTEANNGFKALRREALAGITVTADRFNFCQEITVKLIKKGVPIIEIPVSYAPRTFAEGKKIRARDGLRGLWTVVKYRFVD